MGRYRDDDDWRFLGQVAAIALGVFIGGLGAMFTWESITAWRLEQATHRAAQTMQRSLKQLQQEEQQRAAAQTQLRQKAAAEDAARQSALQVAEQERLNQMARKEAAWQRFYQPSTACRHDSANMVCANRFMAAKKAFEQQYRD